MEEAELSEYSAHLYIANENGGSGMLSRPTINGNS